MSGIRRSLLLTGFVVFCATVVAAPVISSDAAWTTVDEIPAHKVASDVWIKPERYGLFKLSPSPLLGKLKSAPLDREGITAKAAGIEVQIPNPEGSYTTFRVVESPVMEEELANQFPDIKTYSGQGIDDPYSTMRCDWTPQGFHASVISPEGSYYVDPFFKNDKELYSSYYKTDLRQTHPWRCHFSSDGDATGARTEKAITRVSGSQLRTFRLACAATGEYTQFHGGTVALAQAAIVTAVNRVNQVYEIDLATRLVLIGANSTLIYTDPIGDPYTNDNPNSLLTQNQANITALIGSSGYDIGHVVGTGGGGFAAFQVVCNNGTKAMGETGSSSPTGDAFHIDYIAHEMGHQFGGDHSFNGVLDNCSGANRNGPTAMEPGSGSTIMAYAGICSADNLQSNSNAYFHSVSYDQMFSFIQGALCAPVTATGNNPPTVNAGPDFSIPRQTPFTLSATASDVDGDALTYCWEERDLGVAQLASSLDNGSSPIFRSFSPVSSPARTFPKLSDIRNNTVTIGEQMPSVARAALKFRVTVRDNRAGGGGVNSDDMQVNVVGTAGPFQVTSPNTAITFAGNQVVTWNVAGTDLPPINTTLVDIFLSTDGGLTFPTLIADDTPNDGSHNVVIPNTPSVACRIKVAATGNVYWDMSNVNFTIPVIGQVCPVAADVAASTNEDEAVVINDAATDANGDALTISVVSAPANGTAVVNPDRTITYTPAGDYNGPDAFTYKANDGICDSNVATVNLTIAPVEDCITVAPQVPVDCASLADLRVLWTLPATFTCKGTKCKSKGKLVVGNFGAVDAPAFEVKVFLSSDMCLDPSDLQIQFYALKGLKAGKAKKLSLSSKALATVPDPVGKFLIVIANGTATVIECDGTNNISATGPL